MDFIGTCVLLENDDVVELQALAMFGALLPMCSFLLLCEEG
jgi:hypothetical protein